MKFRSRALFMAAIAIAVAALFPILSTDIAKWVIFSWYGYSGDGILQTNESDINPKYTIRLPVTNLISPSGVLYPVSTLSTNVAQIVGNYTLRGVPPCRMLIGIDIVDANSSEQISGFGEVANILAQIEGKLALAIVDSKNRVIFKYSGSLADWRFAKSTNRIYMWQRHEAILFDPSEVYSIQVTGSLPNILANQINLQPFLEGGGLESL